MKKLLLFLVFLFPLFSFASVPVPLAPPSLDLESVTISQLVQFYYREMVKLPYVICSDVLADVRVVSIRAEGRQVDSAMVVSLLGGYGYEAVKQSTGIVYICKKSDKSDDLIPFVYHPQFRSAAYLVDITRSLVRGTFANLRSGPASMSVSPDSSGGSSSTAAAPPIQSSMSASSVDDFIVFSGSDSEVKRLKSLLSQLDIRVGQVVVRGYLYEVGKTETDVSAVSMVLKLLESKISISVVGDKLGNAVSISSGGLDLVGSLLSADGRFKTVTSPSMVVRSGSTGRIQVGQDVPTLGAIVSNGTGQTTQSVSYINSGVILEVSPQVRAGSTDLDLVQTVSDFVQTSTGLQSTPTLNKREIKTSVSVGDGQLLVIGGMDLQSDSGGRSFLPFLPFDLSNSSAKRKSELVLVLEVKKI